MVVSWGQLRLLYLLSPGSCVSQLLSQELKVWTIPGKLLVCSPLWKPDKLALMSVKKYHSSRVDGLASKSEGKQAKGRASFSHVLLCGLPPEGTAHILVALPVSNNLIKEVPQGVSRGLIPDPVKLTAKVSHHTLSVSGL